MITPAVASLALHLLAWIPIINGQGTNATCILGAFDWMSNSLGQSPCLLSSYLLTPRYHDMASYWVFPLGPAQHYQTVLDNAFSDTPCVCNTVYYSTISACATCQGQELFIPEWSTFSFNCTAPTISGYSENIPPNTAVPAWAYLDVRGLDTFDPTSAQDVAQEDLPESTALSSAGPTSSLVGRPSTSGSASATGSPNGNNGGNNDASSKKSTNIAPIVGGAVGGVVGLIAINLAIFFWLRHRRNAARDAPMGPVDLTTGEDKQYSDKSTGLQIDDHGVPAMEYKQPVSPLASASHKVYDPDDPSTFPDNFVAPYLAESPPQPPSAGTVSTAAYKGVPEL
ncbi:hypothetical protein VTO73DRAFT_14794 [Trametes versicolor]